jgi:hypothetical protein
MTDTTTAPVAPEAGQTAPVAPERFRDEQGRFVTASDKPEDTSAAAPVDAAQPAEGAQPQTPDSNSDEKPDPKRERSRQRWQEMKSRVREAENQAQYWRSLAERHQQEASRPLDPMQFQSDPEYQAALAAQAMRRVTAQDHAATAQALQVQAGQAAIAAVQMQMDSLRDRIPDIDIITAEPAQGGPIVTDAMGQIIRESDNAALVAYHLAKNPKEARAIANMHPIQAARELGMIEARLSSQPVRRVSQAPAPVQTVSGGQGSSSRDPGSMSFKEYEQYRMSGGG